MSTGSSRCRRLTSHGYTSSSPRGGNGSRYGRSCADTTDPPPTAPGGSATISTAAPPVGEGAWDESVVRCEPSCSEYAERPSALTVGPWPRSGLASSSWSGSPTPTQTPKPRNWHERYMRCGCCEMSNQLRTSRDQPSSL